MKNTRIRHLVDSDNFRLLYQTTDTWITPTITIGEELQLEGGMRNLP